MLEMRLIMAYLHSLANPDAPVVVTGKGESGVMARWLIDHGVPAERIIEETEATSTNENLENSRALFPDAERLVVVTSDFHAPRTRVWAAHLGVPITVMRAVTPPTSKPKNYAREMIALPHSVIRVLWRKLVRLLFGR